MPRSLLSASCYSGNYSRKSERDDPTFKSPPLDLAYSDLWPGIMNQRVKQRAQLLQSCYFSQ